MEPDEEIVFNFVFFNFVNDIKSLVSKTTEKKLIDKSKILKKYYIEKEGSLLIKYLIVPIFKIPLERYSSINLVEYAKIHLTILKHCNYFAKRLIVNLK